MSQCSSFILRMFLKQNVEALIKEVKHLFIFVLPARKLHNKYCDYLFFNERLFSEKVQKTLSLYSIILHFCFWKCSCSVKNKDYCILCSKAPTQSADDKVLFEDILIDWRNFSQKILLFSRDSSMMSLSIFLNSTRWLSKFPKHQCEEFYRIKTPFKLFKKVLNIMVRVYLNKLIEILDKLNVSHHEYIFIRKHICWQAYDLMFELRSETNVGFFKDLFNKVCYMKNYFCFCFFVQNNSADYIDLTK